MILITGGTGFIGKVLVKRLLDSGHSVRLLARKPEEARKLFPKAGVFKGDVLRKETLKKPLEGVQQVIHLAGIVSYSLPEEKINRINVEGTKNLLELCGDVDKFIFSSSVGAMGPTKDKPADEETECDPVTPYGRSKLEAEDVIQEYEIPSLMLRLAPVYGEGSPSWNKNLRLLEKGFPIPSTSNLTHVVHVSDAARAFELGLKRGDGVCIIADKEPVKFLDFARTLAELLNVKPKEAPVWLAKLIAKFKGMSTYLNVLIMNRNYDISKARETLKYEPKAELEPGLRRMVNSYLKKSK